MFNIVWLKRDLRLFDHEPLQKAIESGHPTILLFVIEPILLKSEDYSQRHWQFMRDCIKDMQVSLGPIHNETLLLLEGNFIEILQTFIEHLGNFILYSHQETGNSITFGRDRQTKEWCKKYSIEWKEFRQHAVERGRMNRNDWDKQWYSFMTSPICSPNLSDLKKLEFDREIFEKYKIKYKVTTNNFIQRGGTTLAMEHLATFLNSRIKNYSKHISKPFESRTSCSRLSAHLSWGSLSIRYLYQKTIVSPTERNRNFKNFVSRLHWHCHFIQKLESDPSIEFSNQNISFDSIRKHCNHDFLKRYENGSTGIPIVDASIRCLNQTGYLNFRLRAMLVSFWTHLLWQPWNSISKYLARQFTDFEPGIHYTQIQMQASTVGYHTIRIYNPTKLAFDHDPACEFIKKWVPELKNLPVDLCIEPWKINPMEEEFYQFNLKQDYFIPIVDILPALKNASKSLHTIKSKKETRIKSHQIMQIHVNPKKKG